MKNEMQQTMLDQFYRIEGVQSVNIVAQNGETIG